ncbi:DUF1125 domain-containing protein [Lactococcus lactis]|uniref:DUF1125 domain-containing protein n=1 Tax=Lactococcus lactis TaxID=1358 RepID=UPI001179C022|nr:DUF1125 domain-containing protein [Lactococcus lactis]TRW65311.1 DUF1125 domain-containing protein [Lactococcus lactis]TRW69710.1 DUF1125 domain-containing protein [Lactococcus lactis]
MTVESLLKTISEGMTVNVKDCYGNMIIRFKFGDDIEAFSCGFLYRKIKIIKIKNGSELIAILEDTKND